MNKAELRLKCLELAVSKSADFMDQMTRAKRYEEYISELVEDDSVKTPEAQNRIEPKKLDPAKRTDNSRILP